MHVEVRAEGPVHTLRLDAGRLNVLTLDALRELRGAVRDAEEDPGALAIALLGRDDALSAGLDLATLEKGGEPARALLAEMGELLLALYGGGTPVVVGCHGHAVAAGAMLLLAADRRIGAEGHYRVGFSEVSRGLALPGLPVLLARERLDPRRLQDATVLAQLFDPAGAAAAGFLDRVVPSSQLEYAVAREAEALAALPRDAYLETVRRVRGPTLAHMRELLDSRP